MRRDSGFISCCFFPTAKFSCLNSLLYRGPSGARKLLDYKRIIVLGREKVLLFHSWLE